MIKEDARFTYECMRAKKQRFLLTLTIKNPSLADAGMYRCNAFNPFGDSNANIDLKFESKRNNDQESYMKVQWKPLNVITLGQRESDNIIRMITISKSPSPIKYLTKSNMTKLGQFDHINRMITLSVITLSGFHCINTKVAGIVSGNPVPGALSCESMYWYYFGDHESGDSKIRFVDLFRKNRIQKYLICINL